MRQLIVLAVCVTCLSALRAEDWPQWQGVRRDSEWRETGLIEKFPATGAKVLWRMPLSYGYSGPAAANGKVYVYDFLIKGEAPADINKKSTIPGEERLQCLDAATGKPLWEHKYPVEYNISYAGGPRATPTVSGGKVYLLGAEGNLTCLDANSGSKIWSQDIHDTFKAKTPMWGFSCHPLVDGNKLICIGGGDGAVAFAVNKDDGKEIWRSLGGVQPGYSSPVIMEAGGARQLLVWSAESLNGLDPEDGKPYWTVPCAPTNFMSIMQPVRSGDVVYVGARINTGVAVKLDPAKPDAKGIWRGDAKTGLFAKTCGPVVDGEYIYGVCEGGELRCVKAETGERLWESFEPVAGVKAGSGAAYLVKNAGRWIIFNEKGDLVFAKLSPKGYEELSRAHILEPTSECFGRKVVWSHPAFADRKCFARNDKEIVCISLAAE